MKTYHWIIAIITLPIFIIGFGSSAWTLFSTITERSGFSGTVYSNYDISKFTFSLITFINALLFGGMVTIQCLNLWRRNPKGLNQSYIVSAVCVVIIILLEYYLHLNFVGKG